MIIYKITNSINEKIYIGKELRASLDYYGSGTLINRALLKYGKENFSKEILEYCTSKDHLNEREIFWINELIATERHIGYNIAKGGAGGDTTSMNPNKINIIQKRKASRAKTLKDDPNITRNAGLQISTTLKNNPEIIERSQQKRNITIKENPEIMKNARIKTSETLKNNPEIIELAKIKRRNTNINNPEIIINAIKKRAPKLLKSFLIDSVKYVGIGITAKKMKITRHALMKRLDSDKFPTYIRL